MINALAVINFLVIGLILSLIITSKKSNNYKTAPHYFTVGKFIFYGWTAALGLCAVFWLLGFAIMNSAIFFMG